jgi:hypothetical protein
LAVVEVFAGATQGNTKLVAALRRPVAGIGVLVILVLAAVTVLRATQHADSARADARRPAGTCTSRLLADWSDGRIDGAYPIRCYRDALKSLPTDLRIYSSAPYDIAHALSRRIQDRASTSSGARTLSGTTASK